MASTAPPAPVRPPRSQPVFRWILVVILGIHAVVAFGQSVLAGAYLSGSLDAMELHGILGSSLTALVMLQGVAALLFWFPGRGPWWPLVASVLLFLVEGLQVGFGYARTLGVHVPLGVAIIVSVIAMFVWSLRWTPRRRTGRGPGRAAGDPPPGPHPRGGPYSPDPYPPGAHPPDPYPPGAHPPDPYQPGEHPPDPYPPGAYPPGPYPPGPYPRGGPSQPEAPS